MPCNGMIRLLLEDSDQEAQSRGRYLVKDFGLSGEAVLTPIRGRLQQLADNSTSEMHEIYSLLRELRSEGTGARPEVEAATERVA